MERQIQFYQKPITKGLELQFWDWFSRCPGIGMSNKQPCCLITMGDLPNPASKSYVLTYIRTDVSVYKETHVLLILRKWNASCLLHF